MLQDCQNNTLKERWSHIDLMESIGIFFVLIYHSTTYSYSWIDNSSAVFYLRYFLRTILSTCVPIFFFTNGYLLLNRPFHLKKHIVKTVRIIVLTGLWGILALLLLMPIEGEFLSLREFIVYLWTWHQGWINYLWYMGALVCIYIFFPLLKNAFDTNKKVFIYFTITCSILTFGNVFIADCASILLNLLNMSSELGRANFFNMFNPFRGIYGYAFVYFCIGGLAHGCKEKIKKIDIRKRNTFAAIITILCCFGLFLTGIILSSNKSESWDVVWNGYDTIFTFINVIMIFTLCLSYHRRNRFIESVSMNTLGIYFIHEIFIHLTKRYIVQFPIFSTFVGCAFYAFMILVFCLIITKLIHRIPLIKYTLKL